jgi:uncharacterized SAM-binding protein YcdF (DUF218 family)
MNVLLKGRSTQSGVSAPLWQLRLCGAALGYVFVFLADSLGLSDVLGIAQFPLRVLALIAGALIAPTAWGALLWLMTGTLVTVSMLVAFTPIVGAPASHFVRTDTDSAHIDAVVVLSGSINSTGRLKGAVVDRLLSGIAEARKHHATELALSIITSVSGTQHVNSEADQRELVALLAPDLTLQFVRDVASTRDEAIRFAALAKSRGWNRVALVTSPLHTRRACRTFEVAGLSVTCVPATSREYSVARLNGAYERTSAFRDVVYESAATVLYSLRGWI